MILSMTGYGDAQLQHNGMALNLEIRSLNSRHLKVAVKLPDWLGFLEPDVERQLRTRISRGTVQYTLKVRGIGESAAHEVNWDALRGYLRQLAQLPRLTSSEDAWRLQLTADLSTLMLLPGVCLPREENLRDISDWRPVVEQLTDTALTRLDAMRRTEGAALWTDLERQCQTISTHLSSVAKRAPDVVADYGHRLRERVNALLGGAGLSVTPAELIRELALFADRCDISEELTRLAGHVEQFLTTGRQEEAAGRKLEFLAQEMLREANTIGSKANDAQLLRLIVEIKTAVDRIKEQVQNLE